MDSYKAESALLIDNLKWMDSDEAGLCKSCGREIAYTRLVAVPDTRLCISCANKEGNN